MSCIGDQHQAADKVVMVRRDLASQMEIGRGEKSKTGDQLCVAESDGKTVEEVSSGVCSGVSVHRMLSTQYINFNAGGTTHFRLKRSMISKNSTSRALIKENAAPTIKAMRTYASAR